MGLPVASSLPYELRPDKLIPARFCCHHCFLRFLNMMRCFCFLFFFRCRILARPCQVTNRLASSALRFEKSAGLWPIVTQATEIFASPTALLTSYHPVYFSKLNWSCLHPWRLAEFFCVLGCCFHRSSDSPCVVKC